MGQVRREVKKNLDMPPYTAALRRLPRKVLEIVLGFPVII
jgi:hypothetical protein